LRKVTLAAIALILLVGVSPAFAGHHWGYIGLFADELHSSWCATGVGFYAVEMWIWCVPNVVEGTICSEFRVCYPANVIQSTVTWNDAIISVSLGDLPSGLSVCYIMCQWDWYWIAHQALWVTDPTMTIVYICVHPDTGEYSFANCTPGYPMEPCIIYTNLYLNYGPAEPECLGTATQSASWGAIKSMIE
jgi:hypothetical protein